MPVEISVQGAEELAVIARHLKQTGDGDLRKELLRGIRTATKPLKSAVKQSLSQKLPQRGGLSRTVAGSKITTANRTSGKTAGVRISVKLAGHDMAAIDKGRIRHPTFGHRPWVLQDISPGSVTEPLEEGAADVRRELLDVLEDVARRCANGR